MSSTYFRNVECFKKTIGYDDKYVLIYETAESNVTDMNNRIVWHKWIATSGSYYDLMRHICSSSYEFESGCYKWKPSNKTPEGFIHTCRKAISNAKETNLPYTMTAIIVDKKDEEIVKIIRQLEKLDGLFKTEDSYYIYLKSKDVEQIYWMQDFFNLCKNNYKNMKPYDFAKWFCNKNNYNFTYEPILKLFRD